jgi:DNA-binding NtrC family response regulator
MGKKIEILVIDDEENVLSSVKKLISSRHPDYNLILIEDPFEGLKQIESKHFDLVITDLMMPGMDGLELIKKIRETAPDLKIVMMTGYATMQTALLAMREGAHKYISKPFTRDELLTAVNDILNPTDNKDSTSQ